MKKTLLLFIGLTLAAVIQAQPTWQQCMTSNYRYTLAITTNGYVFGCSGTGMKMSTTGAPATFGTVASFPNLAYYSHLVANGNLVFVGSYHSSPYEGRGVYLSADFGATWAQKNNGLGPDTNVMRLAVMANGVMLANTSDGFIYKIYRSVDYGNTWTQQQNIVEMHSVTVRSATEAYMCAAYNFLKSVDNGLTWSIVSATPLNDLVILSSGVFIATANNSIMQSVDNGVTWTTLVSTGLPSTLQCGSFLKTPGDTVFYANSTAPWGLFYSTDACATWATCETGFTSTPQLFRDELALSSNGYLFAGPSYGGIARTTVPISYITTETIENPFAENSSVYPNPSSGKIFISTNEPGNCLYTVFTIEGEEIYSQFLSAEKAEIDLSGFAPGIYLLKISSGEKSTMRKIVRE